MKCWWCRRERKCSEYRLKYARCFVPLCDNCANGFKDKITESK